MNEPEQEIITKFMTISERDEFLLTNPHMKQTLCAPPTGDSVRLGVRKIDRGFNDVLTKAKKAHLHSNINTL